MFKLNYLPASKKLLILVNVWKIIHLSHGERYVEMLLIITDLNFFQALISQLLGCVYNCIDQSSLDIRTFTVILFPISPFLDCESCLFYIQPFPYHFDLSLSCNFRWYSILCWLTCRHLWWVFAPLFIRTSSIVMLWLELMLIELKLACSRCMTVFH